MERKNGLINKYPNHPTKADQLWKLEFWENNTAYLQLGTFDVFQLSFEWNEFLKNAFNEIRKQKTNDSTNWIWYSYGNIFNPYLF
jgi:hypothetical protein